MPEFNKESVQRFSALFKEWLNCFGGPRLRKEGQPPDMSFVVKRKKAFEDMKKAFEDMLQKNSF